MLITTNDLLDLINLSKDSEKIKEYHREIISDLNCEVKEAIEIYNGIMITFTNCNSITLSGITFNTFLRPHYA